MNKDQIQQLIIQQLSQYNNTAPTQTHYHNGGDVNQLDPNVSLTGFPVFFVSDASVAPTDIFINGKFRFLVDFKSSTTHFWLWTYLVYINATNQQIGEWVGLALGANTGLTVGTTTISGGTNGYILYDNSGVLGEEALPHMPTYRTGQLSSIASFTLPNGGNTNIGPISVSGVSFGAFILASYSSSIGGITMTGYVSSSGNVNVELSNASGTSVTVSSGTLTVLAITYP